jgi:hypothetical protein
VVGKRVTELPVHFADVGFFYPGLVVDPRVYVTIPLNATTDSSPVIGAMGELRSNRRGIAYGDF